MSLYKILYPVHRKWLSKSKSWSMMMRIYEKNLVNRVVPDSEVENEAYRSAELICEGAPMVARWHKQFAREILKTGKVSNKLNNLGYKCYDTEDFQIGYKSFLTKIKPKFKNK